MANNPNILSHKDMVWQQGSNYPPSYPTPPPPNGGVGLCGQGGAGAQQQQSPQQAASTSWIIKEPTAPVVVAAQRIWKPCTCVLTHSTPTCACCGRPMREQADSAMHFGMSDAPVLDHWHLSCLLDQLMRAPTAIMTPRWEDATGACVCTRVASLGSLRAFALANGIP